ncbi:LysM peptidoglycan-binding domain-containing protein [Jiangella alkaliphila]|uniref:LysM peptidoglycan-binding domain-containing protein n=1 Tax=Jiangella alkaliphila TaxID=419479 RepID=UPI000629A8EC|nr:LysM peptidoglycan-binding domain-containing protein [Jiangella alkaliphila]
MVVIVAVLVGIPLALIAVAGNPLPDSVPSWDDVTSALTEPDDGSLFLEVLLWIGWLGWISFAVGLVVEIPAALGGRKAPRLPVLRFQQRAAAGLVAAVAAVFVVGPVGVATAAEPVQPPAPQPAPATTTQAPAASEVATAETAPAAAPEAAQPAMVQRTHTVQRGESLWRIAEQELGDGMRWPEIAELNYGVAQPGGRALDNTHWIDPGWQLRLPPEPAPAAEAVADTGAVTHVVAEGDTLWGIAEQRLGDGARYPELVDASRDTVQPDGGRLTDPDLIRPGWTITVPGTAGTPPVVGDPVSREPVQPPAEETPAEQPPAEEPVQPPAAELPQEPPADEAPAEEAPAEEAPPAEEPVQPPVAEQPGDSEAGDSATQAVGDDVEVPIRTTAGVGALLAAGVLAFIAVRRRSQQRRREPGERIAMPAGALADTERELRGVADPMSVELVDLALRGLAADCARRGVSLPPLRIGRLTSEQFELYLADEAQLPPPFVATDQGHVWLLPAAAGRAFDADELREVPAPYPSLVTVGHGPEDGHLLLDLERLGTLAVVGDREPSREVMAALAVELATSPWADDLQVTLVGTCPELAGGLDTGRIRYLPTAGSLLTELSTRARHDRVAMAESGAYSLDDARARGVAVAAWTPEIVLLGEPLGPDQDAQLADLVQSLPRVAVAAVTSGDGAVGQWSLELTAGQPDAAVLQPVGVNVQPQRLDQHQYHRILELLGVTTQPARPWIDAGGRPADEPEPGEVGPGLLESLEAEFDRSTPAEPDVQPAADVKPVAGAEPVEEVPAATAPETVAAAAPPVPVPGDGPTIALLGPVEVEDADGPVEQSKYRQLTEIAAFIALHPGRGHAALDDAMWPGSRVTQNTRNTAISKLRRWFGRDAHGDDYLPRVDTGYRFHPGVTTDWDEWRSLVGDDPTLAGTQQLVAALELVRGQPFTGVNPRRYGWAEHLKQEMISAIVDAAHELAQRALRGGDAHLARKASTIGLQVEPGMELLWRDRIKAEHLAGNRAGIDDAIARMTAISADLGDDLEVATVRLIAELTSPAPERSGVPERL